MSAVATRLPPPDRVRRARSGAEEHGGREESPRRARSRVAEPLRRPLGSAAPAPARMDPPPPARGQIGQPDRNAAVAASPLLASDASGAACAGRRGQRDRLTRGVERARPGTSASRARASSGDARTSSRVKRGTRRRCRRRWRRGLPPTWWPAGRRGDRGRRTPALDDHRRAAGQLAAIPRSPIGSSPGGPRRRADAGRRSWCLDFGGHGHHRRAAGGRREPARSRAVARFPRRTTCGDIDGAGRQRHGSIGLDPADQDVAELAPPAWPSGTISRSTRPTRPRLSVATTRGV